MLCAFFIEFLIIVLFFIPQFLPIEVHFPLLLRVPWNVKSYKRSQISPIRLRCKNNNKKKSRDFFNHNIDNNIHKNEDDAADDGDDDDDKIREIGKNIAEKKT